MRKIINQIAGFPKIAPALGFSQTAAGDAENGGLRKLQICSTWNQQVGLWISGQFSQTGVLGSAAGRFAKRHFPGNSLEENSLRGFAPPAWRDSAAKNGRFAKNFPLWPYTPAEFGVMMRFRVIEAPTLGP
jgi:hypothetical protein